MLTAIIVAAGSSQRMGFDKLFALLENKPVVAHAIDAFEETASVEEIILVGRPDCLSELKEVVRRQGFGKMKKIIGGGERRQDSVRAGLNEINDKAEFVAVHDAARPLVRPKQIEQVFEACRQHGSAALAEPVKDTLKRVSDDGFICDSVEREQMFALQTPQIFARQLLRQAYDVIFAQNITVTDETSALDQLGHKVAIVSNNEFNFKITVPNDLLLAESVLARRAKAESIR
jgi:2-C-methyl-D-erythritol 4-phosphate cytidylyltransferase